MPKLVIQKSNFTAGEIADDLHSRTDIPQYSNGARELFNVLPMVEGGFKARAGTEYVQKVAVESPQRIIPFDVGSGERFLVVISENLLKVMRQADGAYVFSAYAPWDSFSQISYVQQEYTAWFASSTGTIPIWWLRASDDFTSWVFEVFPLDVAPFGEVNPTPEVSLKPSGKEQGEEIKLEPVAVVPDGYDPDVDPPLTIPDCWTVDDVGKYVTINGGLVRIVRYSNAKLVYGLVLQPLSATVTSIAGAWSLKESVWSATEGYPTCITHFKQRLVAAATTKRPNSIWFSRIGDERNFQLTTLDADAFEVVPSSPRPNRVLHLGVMRDGVVALTATNEVFVSGGGQPFTPTTVTVTEQSNYGASSLAPPIRVGSELLFVQRGYSRLRAMSYRYEIDGLVAEDLSALASHIPRLHGGIRSIVYQQEPDQVVWCVMLDGTVSSCTFNREQQVVAWAQHDFGGRVIDMCSLSGIGDDEVYLLVQRGDGLNDQVIERMTYSSLLDGSYADNMLTSELSLPDLAYLADADTGATWGNQVIDMTYNNSESVTCDTDFVPDAAIARFGIRYTCRARPLPPELSGAPLTSMTGKAKLHKIDLVLRNTKGIKLNGDDVYLAAVGPTAFADVDANTPAFSGYVSVEHRGWSNLHELDVVLERSNPHPLRVLSLIYNMSANND